MFSGFQMAVMTLTARSATTEFLPQRPSHRESAACDFDRLLASRHARDLRRPPSTTKPRRCKSLVPRWFSWYNAAFLFGAASGGLVFGWLGDRIGRVRAMAASIFCFSFFSGLGYFVATPEQLLLLRFLSGMGVGGMWPTGVSLASEAWSDASRPLVAGMLGTSANVGLVILNCARLSSIQVEPDSWRWTLLICASLPHLPGRPRLVRRARIARAGSRHASRRRRQRPATSRWQPCFARRCCG